MLQGHTFSERVRPCLPGTFMSSLLPFTGMHLATVRSDRAVRAEVYTRWPDEFGTCFNQQPLTGQRERDPCNDNSKLLYACGELLDDAANRGAPKDGKDRLCDTATLRQPPVCLRQCAYSQCYRCHQHRLLVEGCRDKRCRPFCACPERLDNAGVLGLPALRPLPCNMPFCVCSLCSRSCLRPLHSTAMDAVQPARFSPQSPMTHCEAGASSSEPHAHWSQPRDKRARLCSGGCMKTLLPNVAFVCRLSAVY